MSSGYKNTLTQADLKQQPTPVTGSNCVN